MRKKVFIDLIHPSSVDIPRWPYFDRPFIDNAHAIAKGGVLTSRTTYAIHTGTHCDTSRHVMEYEFDGRRAGYTHEMPMDTYAGDVVCLPTDIEPWGLTIGKHLDSTCEEVGMEPEELKDMMVCLNTGMHRLSDDSKAYYHYSIGTEVEVGKWFVKYRVRCVAVGSQALDHPLHVAIGNNGMTRMNLLGAFGRLLSEEYKELFGKEAYAEFDKNGYINIYGQKAYDEKFGELETLSCQDTWKPCHKELLGHGTVGMESLGGDLDKVNGKRLRFYCFPLRRYVGDDSMTRCAAEIDEEDLTDVSDRTYRYSGIGHRNSESNGDSGLTYIQRPFDRDK